MVLGKLPRRKFATFLKPRLSLLAKRAWTKCHSTTYDYGLEDWGGNGWSIYYSPLDIRTFVDAPQLEVIENQAGVRQVEEVGEGNLLHEIADQHRRRQVPNRIEVEKRTLPARYFCFPKMTSYASNLLSSWGRSSWTRSSLAVSPRCCLKNLSTRMPETTDSNWEVSMLAACSNLARALGSVGIRSGPDPRVAR